MKLILGDCLVELKTLKENSVDSIVTDPPYGIGFMGKEWDTFKAGGVAREKNVAEDAPKVVRKELYDVSTGTMKKMKNAIPMGGRAAGTYDRSASAIRKYQDWCYEWATECLRVLKPGGHLLASNSSRMYHRMTCGIEDAGFEIRDQIMWVYGSGFPKSLDIGKAIDKSKGAERKVVGKKVSPYTPTGREESPDYGSYEQPTNDKGYLEYDITAPSTKEAKQWDGWGTALKPSHEPIVVARKPFKGTVAENVLRHGTGGLNIDGCRVEIDDNDPNDRSGEQEIGEKSGNTFKLGKAKRGAFTQGRFPANLIHDGSEEVVRLFPETTSGSLLKHHNRKGGKPPIGTFEIRDRSGEAEFLGSSGSAARFFYTAKTSKKERDHNLERNLFNESNGERNNHPTVKPIDLMRYLIRLVTPKGGTVLDPFMGSGSTGKAALLEGMEFIGIEKEEEYLEIAKSRVC